MTAQDTLVRQLGLDENGKKVLARLIATQREIVRKTAEIDALQVSRKADTLELIGRYGVTRYRLHLLLEVSQTTMANIVGATHDE